MVVFTLNIRRGILFWREMLLNMMKVFDTNPPRMVYIHGWVPTPNLCWCLVQNVVKAVHDALAHAVWLRRYGNCVDWLALEWPVAWTGTQYMASPV